MKTNFATPPKTRFAARFAAFVLAFVTSTGVLGATVFRDAAPLPGQQPATDRARARRRQRPRSELSAGAAREVLRLGEFPTPEPGAGEVRVKLATSGVNPSDVKTRAGLRIPTLPFARIVPHSDGAGVIDAVGAGVPASRIGERVWTWNAA